MRLSSTPLASFLFFRKFWILLYRAFSYDSRTAARREAMATLRFPSQASNCRLAAGVKKLCHSPASGVGTECPLRRILRCRSHAATANLSALWGQCRVASSPASIFKTMARAFLRRLSSRWSSRLPANPNARRISPGFRTYFGASACATDSAKSSPRFRASKGSGGFGLFWSSADITRSPF